MTLPQRPAHFRLPTVALTAAVLTVAALPAFGDIRAPAADGTGNVDPIDRPQLIQGYRPALGLKPSPSSSGVLGPGNATTLWLLRLARAHAEPGLQPYAVERFHPALGLRGTEQATGIIWRGGERWASSFELSSAEHALTGNRRMALLGQLHAPLTGGLGVSVGIRYSSLDPGAGAEAPLVNGYTPAPGRGDYAAQQLAYQLQVNYLYGERNTVALTYQSRRESEQFRLGPDPAAPDASQLRVTGEHWFSPSWALRYEIPTLESNGSMRRQGLRLGVQYRF